MYKDIKKIIFLCFECVLFLILLQNIIFGFNTTDMYWQSYHDGTFSWSPKMGDTKSIVRQGAWFQLPDERWLFYVSEDDGNTFLPLKNCSAYINFNDNPRYNMYTFDGSGMIIASQNLNIAFPPSNRLYINIFNTNIVLKLQPGGVCIKDGAIINMVKN